MRLLALILAVISFNTVNADCYSCQVMQNMVQENFSGLQHIDKKNPRHMIVFSSAPGLARHELACLLEEGLEAIRIDIDYIGARLMRAGFNPMVAPEGGLYSPLEAFLLATLQQLQASSPNQLIILDGDIDVSWEKVSRHAQNFAYPLTVIRVVGDIDPDACPGRLHAYASFPVEFASFEVSEDGFVELLDELINELAL